MLEYLDSLSPYLWMLFFGAAGAAASIMNGGKNMKREFKKENGERWVRAYISIFHVYHEECKPGDKKTESAWVNTRGTCCAGCGEPIYK